MADLVELQIHRALVADEEERCRALEASTGKVVQRREVARWKRLGPKALLQDTDLLERVTEFDYRLVNRSFQAYCRARGVLHVAGRRESRRWEYFADHWRIEAEFMADPFFRCAEPHNGTRHQFTEVEMVTQWRGMRLGRARLQDCWELYLAERSHAGGADDQRPDGSVEIE